MRALSESEMSMVAGGDGGDDELNLLPSDVSCEAEDSFSFEETKGGGDDSADPDPQKLSEEAKQRIRDAQAEQDRADAEQAKKDAADRKVRELEARVEKAENELAKAKGGDAGKCTADVLITGSGGAILASETGPGAALAFIVAGAVEWLTNSDCKIYYPKQKTL